jgi:large repetitive protein
MAVLRHPFATPLLATLALIGAAGASGAPVNAYTASSEPTVVKPATSRVYTVRLRNDGSSPDRAQRARVGIPVGFSVSAASATTSATGTCAASTWVADGTLIANGAINVKKPTGNTTELCPDGTLTVSITASAPEEGLWTWSTALLRDTTAFSLQGSQPTVRVDGTAPVALLDSAPSDPSNDPTPSFGFSANEAGVSFECKLDAGVFAACTSPQSYSTLADGMHTFALRATDEAGNAGGIVSHTWTIGTVEPLTHIDAAPASHSSSRSATFAFSTDTLLPIFECKLDDGAFALCLSPTEYTDLSEGRHTFQVRATNLAGTGSPIGHTWTVDTTAPTAAIQSKPAPLGSSTSAAFTFTADESGVTFRCKLDAAAFAACASPRTYSSVADGAHLFSVQATDRAGNVGPAATHAWTVDTTPPDTSITANPPPVSGSTSASFSFTANEPGSTFECQLDAGTYGSCGTPRSYAGLGQGQHAFSVRAIDGAGNVDQTPSSVVWVVDTIAPETAILSKPPTPTNSTSAAFTFSADEAGATFECKLDLGAFAPCTASQTYSALADGQHVLTVRARDAAGNADATPASHAWTIDREPPETTIGTGPPDPSSSGLAVFEFTSSEASTFECKVDAALFSTCTSPISYSLSDGTHTFHVRSRDAAGNVESTPATRTWRIDTLEPDTTINAKPRDPKNSVDATFEFSSPDAGVAFECRLDSGSFAVCVSPKSYTGLAEGRHTFEVRARDLSGNADKTPATHSWTVDVTSPETSVTSGPPNPASSRDATIFISTNEPGAGLECKLDGGSFTVCTSPVGYLGLIEGPHTVQARATDAAGNVDPSPATFSWTVDVTAPNTTIDDGPSSVTNTGNATLTFSSGDATAVFQCQLDGAGYAACASPRTYAGLPDGPHTFNVRARDPAGNADATPAARTWTIDTVPPVVTISSPIPGSAVDDATPAFSGTAGQTAGDGAMVTVRVYAGPTIAGDLLQTFAVMRAGGTWAGAAAPLADGVYTARAEQSDSAGNTGYSATTTFTVDTNGPGAAIIEKPPDPTAATAATFTFSSTDAGATFRCSLDGGAFVLCQSPMTYQGLGPGRHIFSVNAADGAGNVGGTASYSWTVETPPPPGPPSPPAPVSPPAAPDVTPPAEVTRVRVSVASATVTLSWVVPADTDFDRVSISRIAPGKNVRSLTIYQGGGRSITDRGLVNGVRYRYRFRTRDKTGNVSAGVEVAATPGALLAPADGARLAAPPLLRWQPTPRATYYNVQLWRVETSGQAHATRLVKILSAWPSTTRLKLKSRWTFAGKSYRLRAGRYVWYVFPGFGKRAAARYGAFLGGSSFTVVPRKTT